MPLLELNHLNVMWTKIRTFYTNHPAWSALILIVVCSCVIVWGCLTFLNIWTRHGDNVTVPDIKHISYTAAGETLKSHDLKIEISDSIYDKTYPAGTVIESWPRAGSVVKRGRSVYVTITAFSPKHVTVSMPVTGVSVRQAASYLTAIGVSAIRYVSVPSQFPDLVESATVDGRPIGVGSIIPVNATVVLEVGTAIAVDPVDSLDEVPYYDDTDLPESTTSEKAVKEDLQNMSKYIDN